jgi:hypothetical protein
VFGVMHCLRLREIQTGLQETIAPTTAHSLVKILGLPWSIGHGERTNELVFVRNGNLGAGLGGIARS